MPGSSELGIQLSVLRLRKRRLSPRKLHLDEPAPASSWQEPIGHVTAAPGEAGAQRFAPDAPAASLASTAALHLASFAARSALGSAAFQRA